ncbi:MAG: hypothetical protein ABIS14_15315 [Sphingomonas sp.]
MKLLGLMSAGLVATMMVPAVASAQMHSDTTVTRTKTVVRDGEPRHGWNKPHVRRVCRWQWQHHRKVRICRTVRW